MAPWRIRSKTMKSRKRIIKAVSRLLAKPLLAITATLAAIVLAESIVRALGTAPAVKAIHLGSDDCAYKRSTNPILGFKLKANYRNDEPDFIQSYERTNSHGQRDRERTIEKPPGVRRVLLLGDSVVEGYGLPESATISRQLENLYSDGKTEVLNFGVSAYCTRAEVELLETKGFQFEPDIVVLVFVENDFDNFNREAFPLGGTINRPAIVERMYSWSHFFRLACIQGNLFHFGTETHPAEINHRAIGDNNVHDGLERLRELAGLYQFKPLVAIWPRFFDDRIEDVNFMPSLNETLVIEQLAALHEIPTVRLSTFFKRHIADAENEANPRLLFTSGDQLHPSETGSRVAAEAIYEILADLDQGRMAYGVGTSNSASENARAVKLAKTLGEAKPNYARLHNRLGNGLLKAGKMNEAIAEFKRALKEEPAHAGAHNNLGVAYERLGQPAAESHFLQAMELEPDFAHAHYNFARLKRKQGHIGEALAACQKVLELDPNHDGALNILGVELGKLKKFPEAESYLQRAVMNGPDNSEYHNNLGVLYAAQGKLHSAVEEFEAALRADPANAQAVENLNNAQLLLQQLR